ncbi:hypothetical protein C8R44DRAFT_737553 [Mycena epipterygia]|nr:hypothetical protein C8R44DRAFT_737553 [Mycena epipterygia]
MDESSPTLVFNAMPTEVIDDIMARVLDSIFVGSWHAFVALREALCLICKRWKVVIFGSARFWTKITVYRYSNPQYIAEQLSRANNAPLSISLHLIPDASPYDYIAERIETVIGRRHYPARTVVNLTMAAMRMEVLPIMEAVFSRVEVLDVAGEHSASWGPFVEQLWSYRAPNLIRAIFRLPKRTRKGNAKIPAYNNWHALSELALKCVWTAVEPGATSDTVCCRTVLPVIGEATALYAKLTVLRLCTIPATAGMSWATLASALNASAQLELLQLEDVECSDVVNGEAITMESLTHLVLSYQTVGTLTIIASLDMPNLSSFYLGTYTGTVGPLVDRCQRMLAQVAFVDVALNSEDQDEGVRLLRSLASVERLDLQRGSRVMLATFNRLLGEEDFALPRLKMVIFVCEINVKTANSIVTKLMPPRFRLGCRLAAGMFPTGDSDSQVVAEWKRCEDGTGSWVALAVEEPRVSLRWIHI